MKKLIAVMLVLSLTGCQPLARYIWNRGLSKELPWYDKKKFREARKLEKDLKIFLDLAKERKRREQMKRDQERREKKKIFK